MPGPVSDRPADPGTLQQAMADALDNAYGFPQADSGDLAAVCARVADEWWTGRLQRVGWWCVTLRRFLPDGASGTCADGAPHQPVYRDRGDSE